MLPKYLAISLTAWLIFSNAETIAQKPVVAAVAWDDLAREGENNGELRVYQLGDPVEGLTVKISYEGSASNGFDYRCFSNVLVVDKFGKIPVRPILDGIVEGEEMVTIRILPDEAYNIDPEHSQASLLIQDGDLPTVEFVSPSSVQYEQKEEAEVGVRLSGPWEEDVRIEYSVQGVLAEEGVDFEFDSRTLVIPAGETLAFIRFRLINDELPEDEETVVIRMTGASGAVISTTESHYLAIRNDDGELAYSEIHDRIYGTVLAFRAGSSMGAFTEYNWTQDRILEIFGHVENFFPFKHYGDNWTHPAGATEDGGERHKLICTAIMEKQDRIGYKELKDVWMRDCELEDMRYMTQNYDQVLYNYARWGVPPADMPVTKFGQPSDLGEHIHLTARTFQALPIINAGDPENAITDMREMGKLYYENPEDDAFAWGAVYNAAMALAMIPGATVNSVIEGALEYATPEIEQELRYVLDIAEKYENPMDRDFWQALTDVYMDPESPYNAFDRIENYPNSSVYENVGFAFALFKATDGNVKQSVIIATNRGYDTDCTAASAAALCGALTGTSTIPEDWIAILDAGIAENPYTNAHFTNRATADGLFRALQQKVLRMDREANNKTYVKLMNEAGLFPAR